MSLLEDLVLLSILVVSIYIITGYRNNIPLCILCLLLIGTIILYKLQAHDPMVEHLQISGEAVQNVGSIFNSEEMKVKNIGADNVTVFGTLRSNGPNVVLGGTQDKNRWVLHTPNDDRKSLILGPGNGTDTWDWGKSVIINNNGSIGMNGWTIDASEGKLQFKFNGKTKVQFDDKGKIYRTISLWGADMLTPIS